MNGLAVWLILTSPNFQVLLYSKSSLHTRSGDAVVSSTGDPVGGALLLDSCGRLEFGLHIR